MEPYLPGFLFRNGHFNTIYTTLLKKTPDPSFERITINTFDNDFLDLDVLQNKSEKLVLLCHGLEGSSQSKYIKRTANLLFQNGFDICAMNYRGCSGRINNTLNFYHSGFTRDLHTVVEFFKPLYKEINLIGFSLGGNLVLKYLGEDTYIKPENITKCIAVSVPLNLHSSSLELLKFQNILYTKRFLNSLRRKLILKKEQFPENIDLKPLRKIRNLMEFDDVYTAPLHGFKNAVDYYNKCSSSQFLYGIKVPFFIINALDDPFLSKDCYPEISNPLGKAFYTHYGGHVGFFKKGDYCWNEVLINQLLDTQSNI